MASVEVMVLSTLGEAMTCSNASVVTLNLVTDNPPLTTKLGTATTTAGRAIFGFMPTFKATNARLEAVASHISTASCDPVCGDGRVWGEEECDDGNTVSGGCVFSIGGSVGLRENLLVPAAGLDPSNNMLGARRVHVCERDTLHRIRGRVLNNFIIVINMTYPDACDVRRADHDLHGRR